MSHVLSRIQNSEFGSPDYQFQWLLRILNNEALKGGGKASDLCRLSLRQSPTSEIQARGGGIRWILAILEERT